MSEIIEAISQQAWRSSMTGPSSVLAHREIRQWPAAHGSWLAAAAAYLDQQGWESIELLSWNSFLSTASAYQDTAHRPNIQGHEFADMARYVWGISNHGSNSCTNAVIFRYPDPLRDRQAISSVLPGCGQREGPRFGQSWLAFFIVMGRTPRDILVSSIIRQYDHSRSVG